MEDNYAVSISPAPCNKAQSRLVPTQRWGVKLPAVTVKCCKVHEAAVHPPSSGAVGRRRKPFWLNERPWCSVWELTPACVSAVDCLDPSCSGHGACHHGECHCNPGWGGISCEILKSTCPEQCSNHGTFSTESGTCVCEDKWTGADCSIGEQLFFSLFPQKIPELFLSGQLLKLPLELYGPIEMDGLVNLIPGRRLP